MLDKIARVGVAGAIALIVVGTAAFVVIYSVITGTDNDTTKAFATALAGPGIGGLLVAAGKFFSGGTVE